MSQPKVYEYAKELGMETIALMDKIREWNLPVKSHMASLTEEIIDQIQAQLNAEVEKKAASKKKTKAKKKTAKKKTKATAVKKVAKKKVTKKKIAKPVTRATGAASEGEEASAPVPSVKTAASSEAKTTKRRIIRRKAGEVEAKAKEEEALKAAAEIAQQQKEAAEAASAAAASTEGEVSSEAGASGSETTATNESGAQPAVAPRAEIKPSGKIIGRMDLSKVSKSGPGGGSQRPARSAAGRNIRTGFVAQSATEERPPVFDSEKGKDRERVKRKVMAPPAGPGGVKEVPVAAFAATEFRKREVIFQPKKKRISVGEVKKTQLTTPKAHKRVVKVFGNMTVTELADKMGLKATALTRKLMQEGVMAKITTSLDFDTISLIAPEFGYEVENVSRSVEDLVNEVAFGNTSAEPVYRPPVITVMGHVDHGKTTLLDAIRKADVVSGEAGGITQHIGAYKVKLAGGKVASFIDTPGHAAFTAMRARGANATDIVIIVVAADDGVMPQTEEAINHAKAAGVPIIVAVNKIDRPGANVEKIKQQLTEYELIPEEWGGETIFCEVSALKKEGIENLLEQIHLVAEVQDLKANPKQSAMGIVIESKVEKGKGNVATVLVQNGTLKKGDIIVAGQVVGKVRRMSNERGDILKQALPSDPVEITGLPETPAAGDRFDVCQKESEAQEVADLRMKESQDTVDNKKKSIDDIFSKVLNPNLKELSVVLKSDVAGSNEAIKGMIAKLVNDEVDVNIIHSGVGMISESDVLLASTAGGTIIGFNVKADSNAQRVAKEKNIQLKTYTIIYELMDDLKALMSGMLNPDIIEKPMGTAEVRETFSVPRIGLIAGCLVQEGKITRNSLARLVRDGKVVHEGKLSSLKRFKDDAKEVKAGIECGIGIEDYTEIKVGDTIEAYENEEIAREIDALIKKKADALKAAEEKASQAEAAGS